MKRLVATPSTAEDQANANSCPFWKVLLACFHVPCQLHIMHERCSDDKEGSRAQGKEYGPIHRASYKPSLAGATLEP